ncbi:hypothetical protein [Clostridium cochlearium]|uniref:hypothetical protein n=1 Tax=Clostridium cochlearium TaxID=1494 RepID=UPI001C0F2C16|nr:hypothetical protein [Clostridium cochlearium]MBU5268877.1 hypothetical protein [Clostridium cochlearium]
MIYAIQWNSNALNGKGQVQWIKMKSPYKFLIKQNNQYYAIKPEFYQDGQFQPLTLEGREQPNENDYKNFGFEYVNDLLTPIQVGEENFRPYDKLDNEFEICMLTDKE